MRDQTTVGVSIWQRNYSLLFISKAVKVFGDNFANVAIPWLMFELGGNASNSLLLYTANIMPMLLLGFLVSPLIGRGRLKHWMFASDLVRGSIVLCVPLLCLYMGTLPLWVFYCTAFIQSACGSVYNPAAMALLPRLVKKDQIQKGNALLESAGQIMRLVALTLSGFIITLTSARTGLFITAAMFLISGITVLRIQERQASKGPLDSISTPELNSTESTVSISYWQQIREGFRIVRGNKVIFAITTFCIFLNAGIVPWDSLVSYLVYKQTGGSAVALTMIRASSMIGAFLMGLLLARVAIVRQGVLFITAGILGGSVLILVGIFPFVWILIITAFVFGMSVTAINIPELVIIQTTVSEEKQALVFSVISAFGMICVPLATLIISLLANFFTIGLLIAGGGLLMVIAGIIVALITPLKKFRVRNNQCENTVMLNIEEHSQSHLEAAPHLQSHL